MNERGRQDGQWICRRKKINEIFFLKIAQHVNGRTKLSEVV